MTRSLRNLLSGAAFGLAAFGGQAALAEVTPEQLFQAWVERAPDFGGRLTATPLAQEGGLRLTDLTFTATTGAALHLGEMTLRPGVAGGVDILLPARFEVMLAARPDRPRPGPDRLIFLVSAPGFAAHVDAIGAEGSAYTLSAPSLAVTLDRTQPALPAPQHVGMTLALADLALDWQDMRDAQGNRASGRLALGTLHGDFSYLLTEGPDPAGAGAVTLDAQALSAGAELVVPPRPAGPDTGPHSQDFAAFVAEIGAGALMDLRGDLGALSLSGQITPAGEDEVAFAVDSADLGGMARMAEARIDYASWLGAGSLFLGLTEPGAPPQRYGLGWADYRSGFGVSLADPVADSPWNLLFRLSGLTLSDDVWQLLDPRLVLPRDPASVTLDLSGVYALDPGAMRPGGLTFPIEDLPIRSLTIELNQFLLNALGADLTATGGISLDDSTSFGPDALPGSDPVATGRMDVLTRGASGLVDRLGQAGLVTDSDLTSLRFLLLMLGRAGAQPDTLETTLEFRGGHAFLNGQRLD